MSECETYQRMCTDVVLGQLTDQEEARLYEHLSFCADCVSFYEKSESAADSYAEHGSDEPPSEYWAGYLRRLDHRLTDLESEKRPARHDTLQPARRPTFRPARRTLRVAAGIVLFALGVLIGRATVEPISTDSPPRAAAIASELDAAAAQYLTKAHTLLLSLSNSDPYSMTEESVEQHQRAATRLLHESESLRARLPSSDHRMLVGLMDDVEVVLLQVANADSAIPFLVQESIEEQGLLLQINLFLIDHEATTRNVHL